MNNQISPIVSAYIQAKNAHDTTAMLACFAENAVVHDDGEDKEFHGIKAIREWIEATTRQYRVTLEVIHVKSIENEMVVTTNVAGNFPGSPIPFEYRFGLENAKIIFLRVNVQ